MSNIHRNYFAQPTIGKEQTMKALKTCTLALAFGLSTAVLAAGPAGMTPDQTNQGGSAHGGMGNMGGMGGSQAGSMSSGNMQGSGSMQGSTMQGSGSMQGVGNMQGSGTMQGMGNATAHGEIRKVDKSAKKLTIKHGPLPNLGMGAMTMVYKVTDPAMLDQVKKGDKINFVAENINGVLTVTNIETTK